MPKENLKRVLATDCGSTTTKAILFEKTETGWRSAFRGEAPTTVEKPVADVTIGAVNAFREVQELSGIKLLAEDISDEQSPLLEMSSEGGIDIYVSTSSAGGGLQMIVAGVVATMTTESAERAALGAGAIVMDSISIDDGREQHERVQKIRHLRPDIVLLAGGTEGGNVNHPLELAETILQSEPRPRFGNTLRLPIVYAANSDAREEVQKILETRFEFMPVDNLRPTLEKENLAPARDAIHELFLNHVMSHAPGYKKLITWSPVPIMPTPAGVGSMVQLAAKEMQKNIVAVDIGGATTDVFSDFKVSADQERVFNRTVSANLGMSYSVANVLLEAGGEQIMRWLPFEISENEVRERLWNKMIRPTSIPQTIEDLLIEQAVCREALRLAFRHHQKLAVGLSGAKTEKTIGDMFSNEAAGSLVKMASLDLIIGSGGVLSHAPNRSSTAMMLLDAFEPTGITELAVDSIFMMPHLGVLAEVCPEASTEIFNRDCLVKLATTISAVGRAKKGKPVMSYSVDGIGSGELMVGEVVLLKVGEGESVKAELVPESRIDIGAGKGVRIEQKLIGGKVGIILDARGRPLELESDESKRIETLKGWYKEFDLSYS